MSKSTSELTIEYIKKYPAIISCLKNNLINYSSLSRFVAKELKIEKESSIEAILVAIRRYQKKLEDKSSLDNRVMDVLKKSEILLKNKISVLIFEKNEFLESIVDFQKKVHNLRGVFYVLEGTSTFTIITQEKFVCELKKNCKSRIVCENLNLALIRIESPKEIEDVPGVVAFLTYIFSENEINILEFISSWTDTLFIVEKKNVDRVLELLDF
jgi:hypothetical protein